MVPQVEKELGYSHISEEFGQVNKIILKTTAIKIYKEL